MNINRTVIKGLSVLIILLFVGIFFIPIPAQETEKLILLTSSNHWLYVGGSGPGNYTKIQDAIENAGNGDSIFVFAGIYTENVVINKLLLLQGENKEKTVIDGGGAQDCIYLSSNADGTIITGFTIQHSGDESGGGIFDQGIDIHASYTLITDNIISNHPINGIGMRCSNHNNISFNTIKDNHRAGIEVEDCRHNIIYRNMFVNNSEWGVMFHFGGVTKDNQVVENFFMDNFKGMALARQAGNEIIRNNFLRNQGGNGRSDFTMFSKSNQNRNMWDANYWDDWNSRGRYRISGLFSFDVDLHPTDVPYDFNRGI